MMAFRAVVIAGLSALLTDICVGAGIGIGIGFAIFTATGATGTTMGDVLIFVLVFFEPSGTKLSLFFCNAFS
jgi:branched-subunit amino acid ABC-type transport system permease component